MFILFMLVTTVASSAIFDIRGVSKSNGELTTERLDYDYYNDYTFTSKPSEREERNLKKPIGTDRVRRSYFTHSCPPETIRVWTMCITENGMMFGIPSESKEKNLKKSDGADRVRRSVLNYRCPPGKVRLGNECVKDLMFKKPGDKKGKNLKKPIGADRSPRSSLFTSGPCPPETIRVGPICIGLHTSLDLWRLFRSAM